MRKNEQGGSQQERITLPNCPACGENRRTKLSIPGHWVDYEILSGDWGLEKCRSCGLVFTNPRPSETLLMAFYSSGKYYPHQTDGQSSTAIRFLISRIEHYCGGTAGIRDKTLLDFGCGGGSLLKHAAERGWRTMGYDIAPTAIDACRSSGIDVTNDLNVLPKDFDVILCSHSLEHVTDFDRILPVFAGLIKRDTGRLFIAVPNAESLRARLSPPWMTKYAGANERYHAFPIHLSHFTRHSLIALLKRYGFEEITTETYGFGLDSYFRAADDEKPGEQEKAATQNEGSIPPQKCGALKQWIQQTFMSLGLGENLLGVFRLPGK